jgi:hypothetical protein
MADPPDTQYYPLLKGRDGELRALAQLDLEQREPLTPLIDVPPQEVTFERDGDEKYIQIETLDEALEGYAARLVKAWGQVDPCLVDLAGFDPSERLANGVHPVSAFFSEARKVGLAAVPVTGPDRDSAQIGAVRDVLSTWPLGAAVRLRGPILFEPDEVAAALPPLLNELRREVGEVDLLLDFGELIKTRVAETLGAAGAVIRAVPDIGGWRSLVLCAGAYPAELGSFVKKNETRPLSRRDWLLWRTLSNPESNLPRVPSFGDYGATRADWLSPFDPTEMSISAKIVYTSEDEWIVVKGERWVTNPTQFHELSRRLRQQPSFYSEDHCPSEASIIRCAENRGGPGNPRVWVTVATRHHLEVVTQQLASLAEQ